MQSSVLIAAATLEIVKIATLLKHVQIAHGKNAVAGCIYISKVASINIYIQYELSNFSVYIRKSYVTLLLLFDGCSTCYCWLVVFPLTCICYYLVKIRPTIVDIQKNKRENEPGKKQSS